eukprot:TRINITY_DN34925_c0_g1_i1.p1 TRINITY_DN34925_c0_g1~~TRINITY_DN34925_c0_g1_i1.p1  ORF type:complete len:140 (-),score=9.24 TRINITY_DN34925_c0_g1_i1:92-511(-)
MPFDVSFARLSDLFRRLESAAISKPNDAPLPLTPGSDVRLWASEFESILDVLCSPFKLNSVAVTHRNLVFEDMKASTWLSKHPVPTALGVPTWPAAVDRMMETDVHHCSHHRRVNGLYRRTLIRALHAASVADNDQKTE